MDPSERSCGKVGLFSSKVIWDDWELCYFDLAFKLTFLGIKKKKMQGIIHKLHDAVGLKPYQPPFPTQPKKVFHTSQMTLLFRKLYSFEVPSVEAINSSQKIHNRA